MDCPVCGNDKISSFATMCSECGTDIVAYPLLDDLEEQCLVALKEKVTLGGELTSMEQLRRSDRRGYRKSMARMFFFLLLCPILFLWCGKKNIVVKDNTEIELLTGRNSELELKIHELESEIADLKKQPSEVLHIIEKDDSLYKVSKKYLGDAEKWRTIHALNPDIRDFKRLMPGDTIIIKLK